MQAYTVTQVADYLRTLLDTDPNVRNIWVTGELSNVFKSAAGHNYFTVKDAESQLKAVLFSGNFGAEHVVSGAQVNLHGRVSFYPVRGDAQFYADAVVPAGEGALAAEFERLKAKLEAEGLFDPSRKRALPPFPRRIGVVTSAQGAVLHDIANTLRARYPLGELVLCPAQVQGADAAPDIAEAIRTLDEQPSIDVIIVARGGGSMEDLWAFNTEVVARAIYACRAPVVSGVGHEPDVTIADFVADLRAPTPTAAAAVAAPNVVELAREIAALAQRASQAADACLDQQRRSVELMVAQMRQHLPNAPMQRQRVDDLLERARAGLGAIIRLRSEQIASLEKALTALNPASVLERGFAVVTTMDGNTIVNAADVQRGDRVRATLNRGYFEAQVQ